MLKLLIRAVVSLTPSPSPAGGRGARGEGKIHRYWWSILLLTFLLPTAAHADITVQDDLGRKLTLPAPAQRIVSLAPSITETFFAAGAGGQLVGAVNYSDYPPAAKALPRVGRYDSVDVEAIAALRPDLVVMWQSGNPPGTLGRLEKLGLKVFVNEPRRLEDMPATLERFGLLAGKAGEGAAAAEAFRQHLAALRGKYQGRPPVRVFYQIWNSPMLTVNGAHLISDVLRLCGGRNVFADLPALAPTVGLEAVLAADPEAIVASGMDSRRPPWLDDWQRWPKLKAVSRGNIFFIPSDIINRHAPRILDGAEQLCGDLEQARGRR
jgi:iron complex transport system substrate-binding protein